MFEVFVTAVSFPAISEKKNTSFVLPTDITEQFWMRQLPYSAQNAVYRLLIFFGNGRWYKNWRFKQILPKSLEISFFFFWSFRYLFNRFFGFIALHEFSIGSEYFIWVGAVGLQQYIVSFIRVRIIFCRVISRQYQSETVSVHTQGLKHIF